MKRLSTVAALLVWTLVFTAVLPLAGNAQDSAFQAATPIRRNQEFTVTFHRPNLKDSQVVWINNADTVDAGPALSSEEIDKGFKVGDFIAIRIKAPIDCFVYGVNNSQWDGATLIEKGEKLRAGVERDFVYQLTNNQGQKGVGHENILFLIRTQQIPEEEVAKYLLTPSTGTGPTTGSTSAGTGAKPSSGGDASASVPQIKLGGTPNDQQKAGLALQSEVKKPGKGRVILNVGCSVASIFFPFIGPICNIATRAATGAGFAAATPVRRNQLQPAQDTQNLVVQFSFTVQP